MPTLSQPRPPRRLLTLSTIARRVPCSKSTVHEAIKAGRIVPDFATADGLQLFRERSLARVVRTLLRR